MPYTLLITCEHAGNIVPEKYKPLFHKAHDALNSHEGWDPGAWDVATHMSEQLNLHPIGCFTTRLLTEPNRSLYSSQLFSRYTNQLADAEKAQLINELYLPYRLKVEREIEKLKKPVLHLSIHSFTPIFHGKERSVEIGLLFDPDRKSELAFCQSYAQALTGQLPNLSIQFNEPYLGIDDGVTSHLRALYPDEQYLGIEIEISQKFISDLFPIKESLLIGLKRVLSE